MGKAVAVQKMFDAIAGEYDLMNRVMTMGQDQGWRRFVVSRIVMPGEGRLLDLATGTGDIAALLKKEYPRAYVTGADFSQNMLQFAQKRFAGSSIDWQACDANLLPFADNTFDGVTFGYLLRNVDNVPKVLTEIHRVLKPGGTIVSLDTTPPAKNILYPFITAYLRYGIPILGRMIASDEAAYSYLTGSTMDFYRADDLATAFTDAGFNNVEFKKFMCGTIAVHWGVR